MNQGAPQKRKHRATGKKPPGGKRVGAGRRSGVKNVLPLGAVTAIRSLKHRVPEGTDEAVADLAGEAMETVVAVMRGKWARGASQRLKAAAVVREEICGPVKQRVEHSADASFAELLKEARARAKGGQP